MKHLVFLIMIGLTLESWAQAYIPKFDLQGHRGARGLKPENTIPAFLEALNNGVTTLELDVVITKDNQVVVSHEPWLSPEICLQPDGAPITEVDSKTVFNIYHWKYSDLAFFDCGSKGNVKFPEQQRIESRKPLLRDVIVAVEDYIKTYTRYEVDYNIEIKSSKEGDNKFHPSPELFSDLVFNLVDQYLPWDRVVIQSFDFRVLKYWNKKYPQVRLAALVEKITPEDNSQTALNRFNRLGFTPSIYSPQSSLVTKDIITTMRQKKVRIIPWTVNDAEEMKRLKTLGVDGIITDYPNRAAETGLGLKKNGNGKLNGGARK